MKKTILILLSAFIYVGASCQDKDFYKRTNHHAGLFTTSIVFPDSSKMTSANIGSINWSSINGKPAVFPSEWSIVSNKPTFATVANTGKFSDLLDIPTTFPPAIHNHDALYKPIDYIPAWTEILGKPTTFPSDWSTLTNKPTFATVSSTGKFSDLLDIPTTFPPATHNHNGLYKPIDYTPTWADITGKPTTFPPATHSHSWNDITGKPTFATVATTGSYTDLLNVPQTFTPTPHTHTYDEITDKPVEQELIEAIEYLDYLSLPQKTTTEINALVIPTGKFALVFDKTLGVLKLWNGTTWTIIITSN